MKLADAQALVAATLAAGRAKNFKPLGVVVVDARGALRAAAVEDGNSLRRFEIAQGKAMGAVSMGTGSRALAKVAVERPHFINAVMHLVDSMVPVPGGVLIKDKSGALLGAIGVSGDTSDNDEVAAVEGIQKLGLVADPGA
jgi:uncharacterized protein GlcG (DUF336 family)